MAKFRGVGSAVRVLELGGSQGWRSPPPPPKSVRRNNPRANPPPPPCQGVVRDARTLIMSQNDSQPFQALFCRPGEATSNKAFKFKTRGNSHSPRPASERQTCCTPVPPGLVPGQGPACAWAASIFALPVCAAADVTRQESACQAAVAGHPPSVDHHLLAVTCQNPRRTRQQPPPPPTPPGSVWSEPAPEWEGRQGADVLTMALFSPGGRGVPARLSECAGWHFRWYGLVHLFEEGVLRVAHPDGRGNYFYEVRVGPLSCATF